jgi:hypothetical protein
LESRNNLPGKKFAGGELTLREKKPPGAEPSGIKVRVTLPQRS